jgi:hypothetical protein
MFRACCRLVVGSGASRGEARAVAAAELNGAGAAKANLPATSKRGGQKQLHRDDQTHTNKRTAAAGAKQRLWHTGSGGVDLESEQTCTLHSNNRTHKEVRAQSIADTGLPETFRPPFLRETDVLRAHLLFVNLGGL